MMALAREHSGGGMRLPMPANGRRHASWGGAHRKVFDSAREFGSIVAARKGLRCGSSPGSLSVPERAATRLRKSRAETIFSRGDFISLHTPLYAGRANILAEAIGA